MRTTHELPTQEWFSEWFNSPYYHILYRNRDYREARLFIDGISRLLNFHSGDRILDIACGKGRHSIYLNRQGFDVTGIDISPDSIAHARQYANERLHFSVHDMREPFQDGAFDFVLNLFTSFGYFETEKENIQATCTAARALEPEGKLVLDFFNTPKVLANMPPYEEKHMDGITFEIRKHMEGNFIVKDIDFAAGGEKHHYQERVKALRWDDFLRYFGNAGLEVIHMFGDYHLNAYDAATSDRMIFVAQKKGASNCWS
jgi:SAM-dependent methyltransferase